MFCVKKKKRFNGRIGLCSGKTLGLGLRHYVYIRKTSGGKCELNTFSSIIDRNGSFETRKLKYLKDGSLYPIPVQDVNLP